MEFYPLNSAKSDILVHDCLSFTAIQHVLIKIVARRYRFPSVGQ